VNGFSFFASCLDLIFEVALLLIFVRFTPEESVGLAERISRRRKNRQ